MPSDGGFIAGCIGQIAVDAAHRIIAARRRATNPAGSAALVPLVDLAHANLGGKPCAMPWCKAGSRRTCRRAAPAMARPISLRSLREVRAKWAIIHTSDTLLILHRAAA